MIVWKLDFSNFSKGKYQNQIHQATKLSSSIQLNILGQINFNYLQQNRFMVKRYILLL